MTSAAPKRSLFSKPSWATSAAAPTARTDDDVLFGRHGGKIYEDIVADELKKKEKRAAKAKAREASVGREPKRQRISDDHQYRRESDAASSTNEEGEESREAHVRRAGPATRSTPTKKKFAAVMDSPVKPALEKLQQADATAILLEDDDDFQITATTTASKATKKAVPQKAVVEDLESDTESDDDDDYIRDLKRRSKAKALAPNQAETTRKSPVDPSASMTESLELTQESTPVPEGTSQKDEGPVVRILITSIYPNTKSLIVNQPASRPLKKVKEIWCQRQGFDDMKTKNFFLTWNGARLFDSSNLMNTLEALKRQRPDEDDPSGGNIHLEAMNAVIMEHRKKQKERDEAEAAGPAEHGARDETASEEPRPPSESKIIISLQARDMDPFRLSVRPSTPIFKIMAGFQKQMGIEEGKVCWLVFDGNRLEPNSTVQDAEIEEDDVVEVHIR